MKKIKILWLILLLCCCILPGLDAAADTIYDSPYVTFSPSGKGWTVEAGKTDYEHYPKGTTITTGISSSLRAWRLESIIMQRSVSAVCQ